MIVLNKKRILLVIMSVFLSVFTFMLTSKSDTEINESISTVSLPISGKTIVVDAGHGVPDERSTKL